MAFFKRKKRERTHTEQVEMAIANLTLPDGRLLGDETVATNISIRDGNVALTINVESEAEAKLLAGEQDRIAEKIERIPFVQKATVVFSRHAVAGKNEPEVEVKTPSKSGLADVKSIVAIASGKGGVGKSTCAANIAVALNKSGLRVGLLDADIYGPSVPILFGATHLTPDISEERIQPVVGHGVKLASMGMIAEPDKAMVWRGPMVTTALWQLANDVDWGALDILILDMPPGTGDIQLTVAQRMTLAGAVIVSTPQDLALADVRKGIDMFAKVNVPIDRGSSGGPA